MDKLYTLMISGSIPGLLLQVVPVTLLAGALYALWRGRRLKKRGALVRWGGELLRLLFVLYLTGLANLVLVPANFWTWFWSLVCRGTGEEPPVLCTWEFNLVPIGLEWLAGTRTIGPWVRRMLIYNFLMFLPLGAFLALLFKRVTKGKIWGLAALIPLGVELLQPLMGRSFDVDDLILNFAGILAGYFLACGLRAGVSRMRSQ